MRVEYLNLPDLTELPSTLNGNKIAYIGKVKNLAVIQVKRKNI